MVLAQTNPNAGDRFLFTGREYDSETGLYYYRARYYDPGLGRFISQDPIFFAGGDFNLYQYVGNSPLLATDPSGFQTVVEHNIKTQQGAGGAVAAAAYGSPGSGLAISSTVGNIEIIGLSEAGIHVIAAQVMLTIGALGLLLLLEVTGGLGPAPIAMAARIDVEFGEVEGRVTSSSQYCSAR